MKKKIKNWILNFLGGGSVFIFLNHLIVNIKWFKKNVLCCRSIDDSFSFTTKYKTEWTSDNFFPVRPESKNIYGFFKREIKGKILWKIKLKIEIKIFLGEVVYSFFEIIL